MARAKRHSTDSWEVSIMELRNDKGKKYKVTRRITDLAVAETKVFKLKKKAKKQVAEWLQ